MQDNFANYVIKKLYKSLPQGKNKQRLEKIILTTIPKIHKASIRNKWNAFIEETNEESFSHMNLSKNHIKSEKSINSSRIYNQNTQNTYNSKNSPNTSNTSNTSGTMNNYIINPQIQYPIYVSNINYSIPQYYPPNYPNNSYYYYPNQMQSSNMSSMNNMPNIQNMPNMSNMYNYSANQASNTGNYSQSQQYMTPNEKNYYDKKSKATNNSYK